MYAQLRPIKSLDEEKVSLLLKIHYFYYYYFENYDAALISHFILKTLTIPIVQYIMCKQVDFVFQNTWLFLYALL